MSTDPCLVLLYLMGYCNVPINIVYWLFVYYSKFPTINPLRMWFYLCQLYLAYPHQDIVHCVLTWDYVPLVPTQRISISGIKWTVFTDMRWLSGNTHAHHHDYVGTLSVLWLISKHKERLTGHRSAPLSSLSLLALSASWPAVKPKPTFATQLSLRKLDE